MKTFFIGLSDKLLIVRETIEGFKFASHLQGTRPSRLAFDPQDDKRIYCATNGSGLWRSENGGEDWERIGEPKNSEGFPADNSINSQNITSVAVHPRKQMNGNSVVYVGTEPSMLYISVDNGETWTELKGIQDLPSKENWSFPPRPETHYVRWITPSYSNEDYIAISIEAGAVINSYDGGKTWEDRLEVSPIDAHTLLAHPDAPRKLYAANGDGLSDRKKAYAESKDEGRTWEYKSEGLEEYPYLYHMVVNTEDPNDILVSASKSASTAHSLSGYSTIYRKVGDDKSWSELSDGISCESSYTQHLANDPTKPGAFYAMSNHGIYYLDKGKKLWVKVDIPNLSAYLGDRSYCFAVRQNND